LEDKDSRRKNCIIQSHYGKGKLALLGVHLDWDDETLSQYCESKAHIEAKECLNRRMECMRNILKRMGIQVNEGPYRPIPRPTKIFFLSPYSSMVKDILLRHVPNRENMILQGSYTPKLKVIHYIAIIMDDDIVKDLLGA
jgi:hypothetical protein